jgi:predicted dehydrogenase
MVIRFGIVDCDTSHVVAFTQRLNHLEIAEDQWVEGGRVVAAVPLPSAHSPERVGPYTEQLRGYGVEVLERPEDLLGRIDAVLLEANDGTVHRERAMPFLQAGLPVWIDKPLATTVEDARAIVAAAREHKAPLLSASSLRYDLAVQDVRARRDEVGDVLGIDAFTPAAQHQLNPGWFNYGIHGVEIVYALMGAGCQRVRCVRQEGVDLAIGEWPGGRLASVRGIRKGGSGIGFTAFTEKKILPMMSSRYAYRELLKQIVQMGETRLSPLSDEELIEVVAFQVAANRSMERGGEPIDVRP